MSVESESEMKNGIAHCYDMMVSLVNKQASSIILRTSDIVQFIASLEFEVMLYGGWRAGATYKAYYS